MEKIWFHHFRLRAASTLVGILILTSQIFAEDTAPVKSVIVEVETMIEGDNMVAAKETAQKMAFEKAVGESLPASLDSVSRAQKLKHPGQLIKSFQVIEEKVEGNLLKQKFRCDVAVIAEESPAVPTGEQNQKATFEVAWLPEEVQFNAVDLLKFVADVMGTPTNSVRIGRGNVVLTLTLKKSLAETQSQLASFVGRRGLVKLIHQDETRPPDVLAAPVQPSMMPSPAPVLPSGSLPQDGMAPPPALGFPTSIPTATPSSPPIAAPSAVPAPSIAPLQPSLPPAPSILPAPQPMKP